MLTYDMHNYAASQVPVQHNTPTYAKSNRLNEKYSLRQRDKRKCNNDLNESDTYILHNNSNNNCHSKSNSNNNMHLTTKKRTETQSNQLLTTYRTKRACLAPSTTTTTGANVCKSKAKAAPLSKYRRKTANARERTRMREINTAFEQLRYRVPPAIIGEDANSTNEKLTKITTLRLAMKYIQTLKQALESPEAEAELLQELELAGDQRFTTEYQADYEEEDEEQDEPQSTYLETKQVQTTSKTNLKTTQKLKNTSKKNTGRGQAKSAQSKQRANRKQRVNKSKRSIKCKNAKTISLSPASTSSAYSSQYSNASFSSTISHSSEISNTSTVYDSTNFTALNQIDMNNMLLESDGESLHLSEHCLSPLATHNTHNLFSTTTHSNSFTNFDTPMTLSTLENPLELSLRLLDPAVTDQHQPSACINPLSGLENLTPFCDLLTVDFPENSSLDMFLT